MSLRSLFLIQNFRVFLLTTEFTCRKMQALALLFNSDSPFRLFAQCILLVRHLAPLEPVRSVCPLLRTCIIG